MRNRESDAVGRLAALGGGVVTGGTEPEITLAGPTERANETTATLPVTLRIEQRFGPSALS